MRGSRVGRAVTTSGRRHRGRADNRDRVEPNRHEPSAGVARTLRAGGKSGAATSASSPDRHRMKAIRNGAWTPPTVTTTSSAATP